MRFFHLIFAMPLLSAFMCTEQHDPRQHWDSVKKESQLANRPTERLTDDYKIPAPVVAAQTPSDPIEAKYASLCASCHGADGKADGPAAAALVPRPRNFVDTKWQASVNDEHIAKVIREGGGSVGLSASMAAWGSVLTAEEITGLVERIRKFKP